MKTMTCKQLGGACDKKFSSKTFNEMATLSKQHGIKMMGDLAHQEAMQKMMGLMKYGKMEEWFEDKRKEFESLPKG
jgi:hypothetical protein